MSELEKVWKEFEAMCKTHNGCKNCEWSGLLPCTMLYMFSREQKLKSEAVKVLKELEYGMPLDEAVKKIEGL